MKTLFGFFLFLGSIGPSSAVTFVVNTTDDLPDITLDGICANTSNKCSLRAALTEANNTSTFDAIEFNIPNTDLGCDVNNICRITVTNVSPSDVLEARQPVSIDGSTQPGNAGVCSNDIPNRPAYRIVLQGSSQQPGLRLADGADGSIIRGLNLRRFLNTVAINRAQNSNVECNFIGTDENGTAIAGPNQSNGILVGCDSQNITIGGNTDAKGNLISGHQFDGVQIIGDGGACIPEQPNNIFVLGNFIGTDKSGTVDFGNGFAGVSAFSANAGNMSNIQIGNKTSAPNAGLNGNVISGNDSAGIFLSDRLVDVVIQGNLIGTTASGNTALGNAFDGVFVDDDQCDGIDVPIGVQIGSTSDSNLGNVISGNASGVFVSCTSAVSIGGNVIGLGQDRLTPIANNVGVELKDTTNAVVGSIASPNLISRNTNEGVLVYGNTSFGNRIQGNQMLNNGRLGIDLGLAGANGRNENDLDDLDSGANGFLNTPVIDFFFFPPMAGLIAINFTVESDFNALQSKRVDFFVADSDGDEGASFIGSTMVTGDVTTSASFPSAGIDPNAKIVATLTDLSNNNTSEFSLPFPSPNGIFSNGFEN